MVEEHPLPSRVLLSDSGSAITTSDYSTPTQRAHLYQRLFSSSLPPLTEQAAQYYVSTTSYTPGAFYPSLFRVAARSLKLTASYFTTQPSSIVPGEQGLFLRHSIPAHRNRIFVGFYLGWTHSEDALAPFTPPDQQGKYSHAQPLSRPLPSPIPSLHHSCSPERMNGFGTPASTNSALTRLVDSFLILPPLLSKLTPKYAYVSAHKGTTHGTIMSIIFINVSSTQRLCLPPCNYGMTGQTSFSNIATSQPLRPLPHSLKIQHLISARFFLPSSKCTRLLNRMPLFVFNHTCRYSNGYNHYLLTQNLPITTPSGKLTDHNVPFYPLPSWKSITLICNSNHFPRLTQRDHVAPVFHFVTTMKALIPLSVKTLQINPAITSPFYMLTQISNICTSLLHMLPLTKSHSLRTRLHKAGCLFLQPTTSMATHKRPTPTHALSPHFPMPPVIVPPVLSLLSHPLPPPPST